MTSNGPKTFNAHRPVTPIPAIPKRRLRALDRTFRGSIFSFVGRLPGLPIFGGFPDFLLSFLTFWLVRFSLSFPLDRCSFFFLFIPTFWLGRFLLRISPSSLDVPIFFWFFCFLVDAFCSFHDTQGRLSALRAVLGFPFFLVVLLCTSCIQYLRHNFVIINRSKFPSSEDTRPAADERKLQF